MEILDAIVTEHIVYVWNVGQYKGENMNKLLEIISEPSGKLSWARVAPTLIMVWILADWTCAIIGLPNGSKPSYQELGILLGLGIVKQIQKKDEK